MAASLGDMREFMTWDEGLPHPDWQRIGELIERDTMGDVPDEAWAIAAREWLLFLARSITEREYLVRESPSFLIMSAQPADDAAALAAFGEASLRHLAQTFELERRRGAFGKFVMIAFADMDTYYSYVAHFDIEGRYGASAGSLIDQGYGHVVACPASLDELRATLIHELAHELLANTSAPPWLQEGVAQMVENFAYRAEWTGVLTRANLDAMRRYWSGRKLDSFWSGHSFRLANRGQSHSYLLARLMAQHLWSRDREGFIRLLHEATFEDAGDAAVRNRFGIGLSNLVRKITHPRR